MCHFVSRLDGGRDGDEVEWEGMTVAVSLSVEKRGLITETGYASRSMPTGQISATLRSAWLQNSPAVSHRSRRGKGAHEYTRAPQSPERTLAVVNG